MLSPAMENFLDKTIQMLQNENIKKKIEVLILQPFIQYLIELLFPYVIIICVVFGLLIIMLTSVLYLLIVQMGGPVLQQVAQVTQVASTSTL
jgi:uncharacterized membrane protein